MKLRPSLMIMSPRWKAWLVYSPNLNTKVCLMINLPKMVTKRHSNGSGSRSRLWFINCYLKGKKEWMAIEECTKGRKEAKKLLQVVSVSKNTFGFEGETTMINTSKILQTASCRSPLTASVLFTTSNSVLMTTFYLQPRCPQFWFHWV